MTATETPENKEPGPLLGLGSSAGLGLGPERAAFERWLLCKYPGTVLERDEFNDGRYKNFDVRVAWEAWCERAVARGGSRRFAGWFSELRSGMSHRLWEQGGHEPDGDDVALYEA